MIICSEWLWRRQNNNKKKIKNDLICSFDLKKGKKKKDCSGLNLTTAGFLLLNLIFELVKHISCLKSKRKKQK